MVGATVQLTAAETARLTVVVKVSYLVATMVLSMAASSVGLRAVY
jgi:hypothetical protein